MKNKDKWGLCGLILLILNAMFFFMDYTPGMYVISFLLIIWSKEMTERKYWTKIKK